MKATPEGQTTSVARTLRRWEPSSKVRESVALAAGTFALAVASCTGPDTSILAQALAVSEPEPRCAEETVAFQDPSAWRWAASHVVASPLVTAKDTPQAASKRPPEALIVTVSPSADGVAVSDSWP